PEEPRAPVPADASSSCPEYYGGAVLSGFRTLRLLDVLALCIEDVPGDDEGGLPRARGCANRETALMLPIVLSWLGDSVDQPDATILQVLYLTSLEPATALRRCKERLPLTGDQRIDDEPELVHQPRFDEAR